MKIFVENLQFVAHHGLYEDEREYGRSWRVDLSVDVGQPQASHSDDIADTVDYRGLAEAILEIGTGPPRQLVERVGDEILTRIFETYPAVRSADLTIRKRATGVPGDPEWVGVQMSRTREQ